MSAGLLPTGPHTFYAECPSCKQGIKMRAEIHARLTVVDGKKTGELRLGCTCKPIEHDCRQLIVDVPLPGMDDDQDEDDGIEAEA